MVTNNNSSNPTSSLNSILNMTSAAPSTGPSGARAVFSSILGGAANLAFPGLGTIIGNAIGGSALGSAAMPVLGGQTTQYLQLQQQIETESIAFDTASTVLKVRHDSASKAIDNMK